MTFNLSFVYDMCAWGIFGLLSHLPKYTADMTRENGIYHRIPLRL